MRVAAVIDNGRLAIEERARPQPGPWEVLLRVDRVGICGTDIHIMPHAPLGGVIGHEFIGAVAELGRDVGNLAVGDRVCTIPCIGCGACAPCLAGNPIRCSAVRFHGSGKEPGMGGFGEYVLAGSRECIKLPDSIGTAAAALIEPLAVGLHLIERARIGLGERLLVLGAGPIGLATTLWAKAMGVGKIIVSDPVPMRRGLALKLGATSVVDPVKEEPGAACSRDFGGGPDVVIECIGRPGRLDLAARAAPRDGRVILAGMFTENETYDVSVPFLKGLTVQFVIQYATRHFEHTVLMLEQGRIDPTPMITAEISLEELPRMMETLRRSNAQCKVLVAPNE